MKPISWPFLALVSACFLSALPAIRAEPDKNSPRSVAAKSPSKEALKAEVAGMEDAFCAMAKTSGLRAAFQHFAAPDVAFIDTDPRTFRGLAAVLQRIGPDQPGVSLTWSAMFTDVSDDGTLGYNLGSL